MLSTLLRPGLDSRRKPVSPGQCRVRGDGLGRGMIGAWLMSEGGGALTRSSVGGAAVDGVLTNTPTWVIGGVGPLGGVGRISGGLSFNGSSSYVTCGTALAAPSVFSLACWALSRTNTNYRIFCGRGDGRGGGGTGDWGIIGFGLVGTLNFGTITCFYGQITVSNTPKTLAFCANNQADALLHHFVMTYDGTTLSAYLDGVLKDSGNPGGHDVPTNAPFQIGAGTGPSINVTEYADATVPLVTVYNRALSQQDVLRLYVEPFAFLQPYQPRSWLVSAPGISFDAASNSGAQVAQTTYSWSHTCTGTNRFLAVDVSILSAGATVTGITYNGVAMSQISGAAISTVTSFGRIECWGLANPASGSNTIAVTLSGSITSVGTAVSYTSVHQTSPTEGGNANQATNVGATDATVSVTSVADQDWIHAAIATDDTAITANQTSRNNVSSTGSGADEDFGPQSPGAKTMGWTGVGALATWAIAGYAIRPDTASSLFDVATFPFMPSALRYPERNRVIPY